MSQKKKGPTELIQEECPPELPKRFVLELAEAIQGVFERHIDGKLDKIFEKGEQAELRPNPVWTAGDHEGQPVWWIETKGGRKHYTMTMRVEVSFPEPKP